MFACRPGWPPSPDLALAPWQRPLPMALGVASRTRLVGLLRPRPPPSCGLPAPACGLFTLRLTYSWHLYNTLLFRAHDSGLLTRSSPSLLHGRHLVGPSFLLWVYSRLTALGSYWSTLHYLPAILWAWPRARVAFPLSWAYTSPRKPVGRRCLHLLVVLVLCAIAQYRDTPHLGLV